MKKTPRRGTRVPPALALALTLMAIAVLIDAPSSRPAAVEPARIDIEAFTYAPADLTVPRGTVVVWTNHDEEPHTVTSSSGAFSSGALELDERFTQSFSQPGRYEYHCALHPQMRAAIVVQ